MKFLNDSASFLSEKLKNHVILIKNFNLCLKIQKNLTKYIKFLGFLGTPVETPVETPVSTCQDLSRSVQACLDLSRPGHSWRDLARPGETCPMAVQESRTWPGRHMLPKENQLFFILFIRTLCLWFFFVSMQFKGPCAFLGIRCESPLQPCWIHLIEDYIADAAFKFIEPGSVQLLYTNPGTFPMAVQESRTCPRRHILPEK